MKKYKIQVNINFEGEVEVKTDSQEEAEEIVESYFSATIGNCSDGGCDNIKDWDINYHGETEIL